MCGRTGYVHSDFKAYGIDRVPKDFRPVYNGAPSMRLPQIYVKDNKKDVGLFKFGLIPFWSKTPTVKFSTINAMAEKIFTSPVYRMPIRKHRALTPVDFYFEWKTLTEGSKQPYLFRLKSHESFALGSVWDVWKDAEEKEFPSFSVITTEPNEAAARYHRRMPLIIPKKLWDIWLDESLPEADIKRIMIPFPHPEDMDIFPVSKKLNSPANQDKDVIEKAEE